jgi:hypothetical protein
LGLWQHSVPTDDAYDDEVSPHSAASLFVVGSHHFREKFLCRRVLKLVFCIFLKLDVVSEL